jgi:Mg2+ and Co2+ transporter CorA
MSANATATANLISYYKIVISHIANELLQYVEETCDKDNSQAEDVKQHIAYLRQRVRSLSVYLSYLERRAERQVTATFHLVNQANAFTNLAVARDTKTLAIASKRDSSSMKILAAVTTAFLPGAFVAALFSMNMFNWSAGDGAPIVSGRFWIYWSITVPLTLITVGIWVAWEFCVRSRTTL